MKKILLSAALSAVLLSMPVAVVHAQGGVEQRTPNTRAARKQAAAKKDAASNVAQTYPKATREAPKQVGEAKLAKQLEALFELQTKNDTEDQMISQADAILADSRANAFDKSSAAYLAGSAWLGKDSKDYSNSIRYYKQAIDFNGLHNNLHYQAMLQVAQMLDAQGKHDEALTYVDRFLTETQSEDETAIAIKNQILLGSGKPELAMATVEKQAAAKPNDKKLQLTLASLYQETGNDAKAMEVFERMRKGGMLTESADYDIAWRLLANSNNGQKNALALIDEGLSKGILVPNADIYIYQAQYYYSEGETDKAIAAWTKGAPIAKTGETFLNLSKAQVDKERYAEAKTSARSALDKGLKKPGEAWQVIGQAEAGLGNKAAATAAYREAAKYPETKKWADAELRQASGK
jgi:predicted Zn-dependent protease